MFTDIEDITLDKWLDAENSGQDELAKKILDAGLLVEHMIAEIPLEHNLADNSELRQLTDNADKVFGLIVCFGCNRAFQTKNDQQKSCPNCGAKLSRPDLTSTNLTPSENKKKEKTPFQEPQKHPSAPPTPPEPPSTSSSKKSKKHPRQSKKEKEGEPTTGSNGKSNKTSGPPHPKSPKAPTVTEDEDTETDDEDEGWFGSSTNPAAHSGKHGVKSR